MYLGVGIIGWGLIMVGVLVVLIIGGVFIFLIVVGFVFEGVFGGVFFFYCGIKKSIV